MFTLSISINPFVGFRYTKQLDEDGKLHEKPFECCLHCHKWFGPMSCVESQLTIINFLKSFHVPNINKITNLSPSENAWILKIESVSISSTCKLWSYNTSQCWTNKTSNYRIFQNCSGIKIDSVWTFKLIEFITLIIYKDKRSHNDFLIELIQQTRCSIDSL
jgi:hypothetical protein